MRKNKIALSVTCKSKKPEKPEELLSGQIEKWLEILEVQLEISINKLEFLIQTFEELKKKLADLDMTWEKYIPILNAEILRLYECTEKSE